MRKLFFILAFSSLCISASAQNYQLHSVYIYSFIRYIQWPDVENVEHFTIGVVGNSPVISHLEKMAASKRAGNKDIIIRKFKSAEEVTGCKILFLAKEAGNQLPKILEKIENNNTLLITEEEGLGKKGSNINFVVRNGKLSFELNKSAMERANLKVSTELARLAIII